MRLRHAAQTKQADFHHDLYKHIHKSNYIVQNTINRISLAFGVIENPQLMAISWNPKLAVTKSVATCHASLALATV